MVSENMIVKYLIKCQYFNEYSLNKNVEDEILCLIKKKACVYHVINGYIPKKKYFQRTGKDFNSKNFQLNAS